MSSSLTTVCDDIAALRDVTNLRDIADLAGRCGHHLEHGLRIVETLEAALMSARSDNTRVALWLLVDKLCKQHEFFVDVLRSKLIAWATNGAPTRPTTTGSTEEAEWWATFLLVLDSLKTFFGGSMISLIKLKLDPSLLQAQQTAASSSTAGQQAEDGGSSGGNDRSSRALVAHSSQLRSIGGFMTKLSNTQRTGAEKSALQVRTVDSLMAITMASAYAPARPVEIQVSMAPRDRDAPIGFMQALPENHQEEYETQRRKRLREVMERNRQEDDRKARERLLGRGDDKDGAALATLQGGAAYARGIDFSDVTMPEELPRDSFGVKRANFPQGVRFLRDAIRDCGGAVELDVIVQRISTLANKEVATEFGDVREFLMIHQPTTFRVNMEDDKWVVRLAPSAYSASKTAKATTAAAPLLPSARDLCMTTSDNGAPQNVPLDTECPYCTRMLQSRNLARHMHCRRCVTTQIALGVGTPPTVRGSISEMSYAAKWIIEHRFDFDDNDVLWFGQCIDRSASIPRYRLSSPNKFLPILKAIRVIRDEWLRRKGLSPYQAVIAHVSLDAGDVVVAEFFRIVGSNIFRIPISWIESGDLIDMCKRFCSGVKPSHNPPPRPADPRINLQNEYPGMLLCASEIDSEDEPSDDEVAYSDDEGEAFQFAPPVTTIETLITAGFERDTKRLNHKLRTAPPLVHSRVLRGDGTQTHAQMYYAAAAEKPLSMAARQAAQEAGQQPLGGASSLPSVDETKRVYF